MNKPFKHLINFNHWVWGDAPVPVSLFFIVFYFGVFFLWAAVIDLTRSWVVFLTPFAVGIYISVRMYRGKDG